MDVAEESGTGWSVFVLTAVNLVTIPVAIVLKWKAGEIMGLYFVQSLIVALFAAVRALGIIRLRQPPLEPVEERAENSHVFGCLFFFVFIHVFMAVAVFALGFSLDVAVVVLILAFLAHSVVDFRLDRQRDASEGLPDPMKVIHLALARALPLMLMVMVATNFRQHMLVSLLAIKAIADSALHPAGYGDTRSGPPSPDFSIAGTDVYLPFNLAIGLTILSVLVVVGLSLQIK